MHFEYSSIIPAPVTEVFAFHTKAENFPKILPPEYKVEMTAPGPEVFAKGAEYEFKLSRAGISVAWGCVIEEVIEGEMFRDRQTQGPFSLWLHTHKFADHESGTLLTDLVEYDLPGGLLGKLVDDLFLRRELGRFFATRHQRLTELLASNSERAASAAGGAGRGGAK